MYWTIPGTVLVRPREEAAHIREQFSSMFLAGGLVLSQVAGIAGLEAHTVQNWVKRGFLTAPEKKHYSMEQLCRILSINMLKSVLPMERVCSLLGYINGKLDDPEDDLIDDADLYFLFVHLASRVRELDQDREAILDNALENYREPVPGAKGRVKAVLRVMLTAWISARLQEQVNGMIADLQ